MSFFKDFKDDLSQAVNELMPGEEEGAEARANAIELEDILPEVMLEEEKAVENTAPVAEEKESEPELSAFADILGQSAEDVKEEEAVVDDAVLGDSLFRDVLTEEPEAEILLTEDQPEKEPEVSGPVMEDMEDAVMENTVLDAAPIPEDMDILAEAVRELEEEAGMAINTDTVQEMQVQAVKSGLEPVNLNNSAGEEDITTIARGVHLEGNLRSKGSVELLGDVTGDVICEGKLVVYGSIVGNPSGSEIYANAARIEGNITSKGSVKIGNGSVVIGNISASEAVIGGAVKGDIDVNGAVVIDSTAVIYGNIKTKSIQLNNGAVIEGFVSQSYANVDVEGLFGSKSAKKDKEN